MKSLLASILAALSAVSVSAAHGCPKPHRHASAPRKTEIIVPWKTLAAGGAAAETSTADCRRFSFSCQIAE